MNDSNDSPLGRRGFLQRSAVGALGIGGLAPRYGQDGDDQGGEGDDGRSLISRRFVFDYPERLGPQQEPGETGDPSGDLPQKIVIVTDRKDVYPDELDVRAEEVADCVDGWSADELREWEAIIVDWKNASRVLGSRGAPEKVQATQLVELNSLVANPRSDPIPLGTPYIIRDVQNCSGDLVAVTAEQIPGVRIVTGPGESTDKPAADETPPSEG